MEAVAAFGVACGVLQVINSALKAIEICKQAYEHGSSIDNQDLERQSDLLAGLSDRVRAWSGQLGGPPLTATQSQLQDVAGKCLGTTDLLKEELQKLKRAPCDGRRARFQSSVKTFWRSSTLEKLERKLTKYEAALQTSMLVHMSQEQARSITEQHDCFGNLDELLKAFIQRFADGCSSISALIGQEAVQTQHVITQEASQTRNAILQEASNTRLALVHDGEKADQHLIDRIRALRIEEEIETRRKRFLNSLRFPDVHSRRNDIRDVHEGTFEWALRDNFLGLWDSLPDFLRGDKKLYWIQGKPGSGKSSLMKFVLENRQTMYLISQWRPDPRPLVLSFFFWSAGSAMQRSLQGFWGSLLFQVCSQKPELVDKVAAQKTDLQEKRSLRDWSVKDLSATFLEITRLASHPLFVVVDGLDEFDHGEGASGIIKHIMTLSSIPGAKVLVSSRPELDLKLELHAAFSNIPQMQLQDLTRHDMAIYVEDCLSKAVRKGHLVSIDHVQQHALTNQLIENAEGVFLWIHYVLKSVIFALNRCSTWAELQTLVQRCPRGIYDLYRQMWDRMNPDEESYREEAAKYFYLVAYPTRWRGYEDAGRKVLDHVRTDEPRSVFEMMLVVNRDIQERVLEHWEQVTLTEMVRLCEVTEIRLMARCAGMLEIVDQNHVSRWESEGPCCSRGIGQRSSSIPLLTINTPLEAAKAYLMSRKIKFIHRSARDFLLGTISGQQIMRYYQPDRIDIMLQEIRLNVTIQLTMDATVDVRSSPQSAIYPLIDLYSKNGPDESIVEAVQSLVVSYKRVLCLVESGHFLDRWNLDLRCWPNSWYQTSYPTYPFIDLVGLAATWRLKNFVQSFVNQAGQGRRPRRSYMSYLLLCACNDVSGDLPEVLPLIRWLLSHGANPNQQLFQNLYIDRHHSLHVIPGFRFRLTTPFIKFLESLSYTAFGSGTARHQLAPVLRDFLNAGVSLQQMISVGVACGGLNFSWQAIQEKHFGGSIIVIEVTVLEFLRMALQDSNSYLRSIEHQARERSRRILFTFVNKGEEGSLYFQPTIHDSNLIMDTLDYYFRQMGLLWRSINAEGEFLGEEKDFCDRRSGDYFLLVLENRASLWIESVMKAVDGALKRGELIEEHEARDLFFQNTQIQPNERIPSALELEDPFGDE